MNSGLASAMLLFCSTMLLIFGAIFLRSPLFSNRYVQNRRLKNYFSLAWLKLGKAHKALAVGVVCFSLVVAVLCCYDMRIYVGIEVFVLALLFFNIAINVNLEVQRGKKMTPYWQEQLRRPPGMYLLDIERGTMTVHTHAKGSIVRLWQLACMRCALEGLADVDGEKTTPRIVKQHALYLEIEPLGFTADDFRKVTDKLSATLGKRIYAVEDLDNGNLRIQFERMALPRIIRRADVAREKGFVLGATTNGMIVQPPEEWPHMMVAGTSGSGKSTFMVWLAYMMIKLYPKAVIAVVDVKRKDFEVFMQWPNFVRARSTEHLTAIAQALEAERAKREAGIASMSAPVFLIVDEYNATIDDSNIKNLERLTMMSRSANMHMIFGSQRPTITGSPLTGTIRENLEMRFCFRVKSRRDSRIMLEDVTTAAKLPHIPGRAIAYNSKVGSYVEMQGVYVTRSECVQLMQNMRTRCVKQELAENLREVIAAVDRRQAKEEAARKKE